MSDRFKIRVWDKYEKSYWLQSTIEQNIHWLMNPEEYKDANYPPDYVKIEQCTGLKDKNGKLIYEGDIVKIYAKNRYAYGIFQIKYDCEDCEYDMLDKEGNFIYQLQNDKIKYVEVISNIHENLDLLEQ